MSMSRFPIYTTLFGLALILAASVALGMSGSADAAPDEPVPPAAGSKPADPVPAPVSPTAPTPAAEAPAPAASAEKPVTSGTEKAEEEGTGGQVG